MSTEASRRETGRDINAHYLRTSRGSLPAISIRSSSTGSHPIASASFYGVSTTRVFPTIRSFISEGMARGLAEAGASIVEVRKRGTSSS